MTADIRSLDRKVRFWSVVALGTLLGLRLAVHLYSGPSIALGISIALFVGVAFGLLSLWQRGLVLRLIGYVLLFFG